MLLEFEKINRHRDNSENIMIALDSIVSIQPCCENRYGTCIIMYRKGAEVESIEVKGDYLQMKKKLKMMPGKNQEQFFG